MNCCEVVRFKGGVRGEPSVLLSLIIIHFLQISQMKSLQIREVRFYIGCYVRVFRFICKGLLGVAWVVSLQLV